MFAAVHNVQQLLNNERSLKARKAFALALKEKCFERINYLISQNYNVVLDIWGAISRQELQKKFPHIKIISVLVYCPFSQILQRLLLRNSNAVAIKNVESVRYVMHILHSFADNFVLLSCPDNAIDILKKNELIKAVDFLSNNFQFSGLGFTTDTYVRNELSWQQFLEEKNSMLKQFNQSDELNVVPRLSYDVVLHTDKKNPSQCVKEIIQFCKHC